MTAPDENPHREVRSAIGNFLGPKTNIRIGAWNIRSMYQTSNTAQVIKEIERYRNRSRWVYYPFLRKE